MQKRKFLSLGVGDFVAQPQPAGAESEAGLEAPMYVGRRRGRRGYRNQQNQQLKQQQKQEAMVLKSDQKQANRRARQVGRLKEKDIIHEYGSGKQH
jgi:hypothetical protein